VGFVFTLRADAANLERACARVRALAALAALPEVPWSGEGVLRLEGPLTPEVLRSLPADLPGLSLEDFTKSFLEPADLRRLLDRTPCTVRKGFRLVAFAVSLRGVRPEAFRARAEVPALLLNPFGVAV
jgi:hypothetical protein